MLILNLALRSISRRKVRMTLIGLLVTLGTILIIFGETFSLSAKQLSRLSSINFFTGDLIIYSDKTKESPSPFSFTTPLPPVPEPQRIEQWLESNDLVDRYVSIAQNYGVLSVQRDGRSIDVPFVFYAADPIKYRSAFQNIDIAEGEFFNADGKGPEEGVVLSAFQVENFSKITVSISNREMQLHCCHLMMAAR